MAAITKPIEFSIVGVATIEGNTASVDNINVNLKGQKEVVKYAVASAMILHADVFEAIKGAVEMLNDPLKVVQIRAMIKDVNRVR